ncbi:MAG: ABC transporter ATP-binding protein [Peptoniphilaceae bacterium]|nr:ABC transporter ATP-binding protein [Peptoniphilaceae bacterium]MDY6019721.1 ABC transporter ATP-binding protein [Anaerococcus sp.]
MIIAVKNIEKSFGKNKVLNDFSFALKEANITGLVGRNGSGKTTLLKIMCRIFDPDRGEVSLDGEDIRKNYKLIEHIAYLPDRFDYFNYSKPKEMIEYYQIIYPNFDKDFFIKELEKNEIDLNKNIRNYSKGIKNLLGLITILATRAEILLVDEILDGMDVLNKEIISSYLLDAKEEGRTIFASSHELDQLYGLSDQIIYLTKKGKIEKIVEENDKFSKVQIVVRDKLPEDILKQSILRFNLGRVYTILIGMDKEKVKELLDRDQIVQYDILPSQVEDSFYWERGRK